MKLTAKEQAEMMYNRCLDEGFSRKHAKQESLDEIRDFKDSHLIGSKDGSFTEWDYWMDVETELSKLR